MPGALGNMAHKPAGSQGTSFPNRALLGDAQLGGCSLLQLGACCSSTVPRGSDHPESAGAACMCLLTHVCVCVCFCGFVLAGWD